MTAAGDGDRISEAESINPRRRRISSDWRPDRDVASSTDTCYGHSASRTTTECSVIHADVDHFTNTQVYPGVVNSDHGETEHHFTNTQFYPRAVNSDHGETEHYLIEN